MRSSCVARQVGTACASALPVGSRWNAAAMPIARNADSGGIFTASDLQALAFGAEPRHAMLRILTFHDQALAPAERRVPLRRVRLQLPTWSECERTVRRDVGQVQHPR